ncbi:MAG: hypothetical protein ACOY5F_18635 [Pseudomonadota bacterium]
MIPQDVDERLAFDRHRLPGAARSIMALVQPQNNARETVARRRLSGQFERLASIEARSPLADQAIGDDFRERDSVMEQRM